jgi:hypothetical protein
MPFASLAFDRGPYATNEWMAAGQATCPAGEEEQWKSFDFVNDSAWAELK